MPWSLNVLILFGLEEKRPRWGVRTSNPRKGRLPVLGGFDSHSLPPKRCPLLTIGVRSTRRMGNSRSSSCQARCRPPTGRRSTTTDLAVAGLGSQFRDEGRIIVAGTGLVDPLDTGRMRSRPSAAGVGNAPRARIEMLAQMSLASSGVTKRSCCAPPQGWLLRVRTADFERMVAPVAARPAAG